MTSVMNRNSVMEVNGLRAVINTPAALAGETLYGLPPHYQRPAYAVDEYPACPKNWMHGSSKASSYFVPVQAGRGMWFDFTANQSHEYHIAVVISVQGVNPVTGKKVTELNLEQYRDKCPVHKVDFQQDRFCPECGYAWPAQNYIATTTGQVLWIDGFRNEKGEVRQYIITEEIARGIAAQVIGEDRVWAIGFAFYLSKEPKPVQQTLGIPKTTMPPWGGLDPNSLSDYKGCDLGMMDYESSPGVYGCTGSNGPTGPQGPGGSAGSFGFSGSQPGSKSINTVQCCCAAPSRSMKRSSGISGQSVMRSAPVEPVVQKKMLEIGAGARIQQEIGVDPNPIDFWQAEPIGLIYCNYVDEETMQQIIAAGRREDREESALNGLKVGN